MNPKLPGYHRELLKRLDERQVRLQHDEECARQDAEAEILAKDAEKESLARGLIPAEAVRAVLPAMADPLAPQDPARRDRFARHLEAIVEGALLDRDRIEREPAAADPPPDARETLSASACAACRGSCCGAGGDHAYLTEETMVRAMDARPGRTLAEIVNDYLGYLPAESTRDSCIYHGPEGCGLPRELRSPTCNTYRCAKLTQLRERLPQDAPVPVFAVLFSRGRWTRTALLQGSEVKILAED